MTHPTPRVVVTGLGLRGPGVASPDELWALLQNPVPPPPARVRSYPQSGDVLGYAVDDVPGPSDSRLERLALAAFDDASADAGLTAEALTFAGISFGTTHGRIDLFESSADEQARAEPLYSIGEALARLHVCYGPIQLYSTACSASLTAIGMAAEVLRDGRAEVMIVGGAEIFSDVAMASFTRLGGLDPERCRPFHQERQGAVFGEGAAFLILETEEHALARRAPRPPYCTIEGFGWSCDAHHATAPEPSGRALRLAACDALARAGLTSAHIDCVIPHGTGTRLNDEAEAHLLRDLIAGERPSVPVLPLKAFIGHGAGAAGVFGCIAAALICRHQWVPSANCARPEYPLNFGGQAAGEGKIGHVLVNAYAFGGNNASLILGSA